MPVKKKKTKTIKASSKKTRKKAAKKSSVTKSRPASGGKKKPARKKTIKKQEEKVQVKHASEVHIVTTKHVNLSFSKPKKHHIDLKGFSFPSALSQVRGFVETTEPEDSNVVKKTAMPTGRQEESIKKVVKKGEHFVSPYVLDLRKQQTLLHGVKPKKYNKLENKKSEKQSILSLFETTQAKPLANPLKGMKTFGQQFKAHKSTNFAPIKHKFEPGTHVKRWHRSFLWRLSSRITQLGKPLRQAKSRKLQKTFAMPKNLGKNSVSSLLTTKTRAGKPISSSVFARVKKEVVKQEKFKKQKIKKEYNINNFIPSAFSWKRGALSFAALSLFLILPFGGASLYKELQQAQGEVFGATGTALDDLEKAQLHASQLDFVSASEHFARAGQAFQAAAAVMENELGPFGEVISHVPLIGDQLRTGQELLAAGDQLSQAAALLTQAVDVLNNDQHFLSDQQLSYKLEFLFVRIAEAAPLLNSASEHLQEVDSSLLPEEYQGKIAALKDSLPLVSEQFDRLSSLSEAILPFVGHDSLQRYLIVFQNNTELRATGGFFGSLALADLDLGELTQVEVPGGGPYDYQGSFLDYYQAPRALQLINPRWELQDANWFYDWPTSAKTIASFYEKAGGPSVDGVIAIDTQVLESLLALVGPVDMVDYGVEINADNFKAILQEEVEFNYDKDLNQPKKIIGDLVPVLLSRIQDLDPADYLALGQTLNTLLEQKDVLVQHNNPDINNIFSNLGWTGEVVENKADYLAIVHTNIAGGKTDSVIKDEYNLDVHIDDNGDVTNTLTILRNHNGTRGVPLTGVRNVDYLRVFVPEGSELISATKSMVPPVELFEKPQEDWILHESLVNYQNNYQVDELSGVEIFEESGKTVFGQWVQVDPQEVAEIKIVYKVSNALLKYDVPEREESWTDWITGETAHAPKQLSLYHLYWQKQSGAWSPELDITITYPQQWQAKSQSSVTGQPGAGIWQAQASQVGDSIWSLLMY